MKELSLYLKAWRGSGKLKFWGWLCSIFWRSSLHFHECYSERNSYILVQTCWHGYHCWGGFCTGKCPEVGQVTSNTGVRFIPLNLLYKLSHIDCVLKTGSHSEVGKFCKATWHHVHVLIGSSWDSHKYKLVAVTRARWSVHKVREPGMRHHSEKWVCPTRCVIVTCIRPTPDPWRCERGFIRMIIGTWVWFSCLSTGLRFTADSVIMYCVCSISLGHNFISDAGAPALAAALQVNTTLQTLE